MHSALIVRRGGGHEVNDEATAPITFLANPPAPAYISAREVGAGRCLANPVRSGRKQP
jgi:hypothetical protein